MALLFGIALCGDRRAEAWLLEPAQPDTILVFIVIVPLGGRDVSPHRPAQLMPKAKKYQSAKPAAAHSERCGRAALSVSAHWGMANGVLTFGRGSAGRSRGERRVERDHP